MNYMHGEEAARYLRAGRIDKVGRATRGDTDSIERFFLDLEDFYIIK